MASLDHLFPAANDNAILAAAFALEWLEPMDPQFMAALGGVQAKVMEVGGFSAPQMVNSMTVALQTSPSGTARQIHETRLAGYTFTKADSLGKPLRTVAVNEQRCIVVVHDYTRWDAVWGYVRRVLEALKPAIEAHRKVTSVSLQYNDQFIWKNADEPLPVREVFREGTKYIPQNARERSDGWHSFHGFKFPFAHDWAQEWLDNINVQLTPDSPGSWKLDLITLHRITKKTVDQFTFDQVFDDKIPSLFKQAHDHNKQILRDILAEDVCKRILLESPK